jgi:hypothetical protein
MPFSGRAMLTIGFDVLAGDGSDVRGALEGTSRPTLFATAAGKSNFLNLSFACGLIAAEGKAQMIWRRYVGAISATNTLREHR